MYCMHFASLVPLPPYLDFGYRGTGFNAIQLTEAITLVKHSGRVTLTLDFKSARRTFAHERDGNLGTGVPPRPVVFLAMPRN